MALKYKIGDRVRIKSIDWYNENKDELGVIHCKEDSFVESMTQYCDNILTIEHKTEDCYLVKENTFNWTDEMIEGLVEEETALNKWTGLKVELELSKSVIGVSNVESLHGERFMSGFVKAIIPPDGYIFKDENGNVINATKIVLEKKKKEYPKSYEECAEIVKVEKRHTLAGEIIRNDNYKIELLISFQKLLICRDAYWKIAGEEMGLNRPWEPDYDSGVNKYGIICLNGVVQESNPTTNWERHLNKVLDFPTAEMRDAFYENFKELIEKCKELL